MAANPNPLRISDAIWRLWTEFDAHEPTALLGGVFADKPGYHNYRAALRSSDYSVRDLAADRRGPTNFASALDITLPAAQMRLYTRRLDAAARTRDPRLYTSRGPVLREFIGTLDSKTVYCYVLTGGLPLGVGADAGPDPGRPRSHLWHIHLSFIREFCADWFALSGVLSILIGEAFAKWKTRTPEEIDVADAATIQRLVEDVKRILESGLRPPGTAQTSHGGVPVAWIVRVIKEIQDAQVAQRLLTEAVLAAASSDADRAAVIDIVNRRADELGQRVEQVDENVVAALPGRTDEDLVRVLTELLGEARLRHVAQLILGEQPA